QRLACNYPSAFGLSEQVPKTFADVFSYRAGRLLGLHIVAEERILVSHIHFAICKDRMRPGRQLAAIGLFEATTLYVFLRVWFNEEQGTFFGAVIDSSIRQGQRAFRCAVLGVVALVPEDVASFEIETDEGATFISAIGAVEVAVEDDHAAVVVLHLSGEINFLGFDTAILILA